MMEVFYITLIVIWLLLLCQRLWRYNQFRKSGDIIFTGSYRDWLLVILWSFVGVLWISNLFSFHKELIASREWYAQLSFWVLISSTNIFFVQRTKVTEGGILQNGFYRPWEEIISWEWENTVRPTLVIKAVSKLRFIKKPATYKLRVDPKQKDLLESHLRKYVPANS